jgi:hypothetical protein
MECRTRLDHVVINVRRDMDTAEALCKALGLTVTPRGYHSLGSINHLMMFDTNYFELIGIPKEGEIKRADLITAPIGINGLVFKTDNVDDTHAHLLVQDMAGEPPRAFSRPVELEGETLDAKFRTVTVRPDVFPEGRVYFCEHGTPELVWRPEWLSHPNGAMEIAEVVVVAEDVPKVAGDYARLVDSEVAVLHSGTRVVDLADARLSFRTPKGYQEQYGDLASELGGRSSIFGAVIFRTSSLALVADTLSAMKNRPVAVVGTESIVVRLADYDSVIEFVGPEA